MDSATRFSRKASMPACANAPADNPPCAATGDAASAAAVAAAKKGRRLIAGRTMRIESTHLSIESIESKVAARRIIVPSSGERSTLSNFSFSEAWRAGVS